MDERYYIMIASKEGLFATRRFMYIRAATLKAAWRKAEAHPMLRGWKIRNIQPCSLGMVNGWYTL